jgi:hypothetical protein
MNPLSKSEQLMLCIFLGLLLAVWAVKAYLTARTTVTIAEPANH